MIWPYDYVVRQYDQVGESVHTIACVLNNDVRGGGSMPSTSTATSTAKPKPKPKHKTMHYNAKKCLR